MRLPFLLLTPVCVFLPVAVLDFQQSVYNGYWLLLVTLGALSAHAAVNTLNEYQDFSSGLDLKTVKTPFSGGSGALPDNPRYAAFIHQMSWVFILITLAVGVFFVFQHGWDMLLIGLSGIILIMLYTNWLNKKPFLCLISPGLGFGLLMAAGTALAIAGDIPDLVWVTALLPFFLVNNLLLLNQFPDANADMLAGRKHFVVIYGYRKSSFVYAAFLIFSLLLVVMSVSGELLPPTALLALLPFPLGFVALYGALKFPQKLHLYKGYLAANVILTLSSPLLLGAGLWIA